MMLRQLHLPHGNLRPLVLEQEFLLTVKCNSMFSNSNVRDNSARFSRNYICRGIRTPHLFCRLLNKVLFAWEELFPDIVYHECGLDYFRCNRLYIPIRCSL